jgi:eukaryotic-like serine/threonine-protein kinase
MRDTGAYRLQQRLAAGGMGEVYLGLREGLGGFQKRVAIKVLLPHLDESEPVTTMFLDEARIASRLEHHNVVPVIDFGQWGQRYFMVMPLVEGVSLHQLLRAMKKQHRAMPLPLVRLIARGVCDGLAYAHQVKDEKGAPLNLVHRDLSPSNVLVSHTGGVFVTDFGIAKAAGNRHATRTGEVKGKFAYMPPEQLLGLPVDARTDLYSTGVTLYEVLTGECPFRRDTDAATIDAVRSGSRQPARALRPDCTQGIEAALEQAMATPPDARLPKLEALRDAFLDGPVAQPHELGVFVRELCPEAIARFEATPVRAEGPLSGQVLTKVAEKSASLPPPTVNPAPASPRLPWLMLTVLAAGLVTGAALLLRNTPPAPAEPTPPPVAVTPPPVPVEATAPVAVEPAPPAAPEPVPVEATPAKAVTKPKPARLSKSGRGTVSIDASPWAMVTLDGKSLGETPIAPLSLLEGKHEVRLQFLGTGIAVSRPFEVADGERLHVLGEGARRTVQVKRSPP